MSWPVDLRAVQSANTCSIQCHRGDLGGSDGGGNVGGRCVLLARFPGCGRTRLCEGHHIVFWGKGGPTDKENILLTCRFHHRLLHEGGWRIEGDAEGTVSFVSSLGRRLDSSRVPFPEEIRQRLLGDGCRTGM